MSSKGSASRQMALGINEVLFDERFLAAHVGKNLLTDSKAAIVELIANCWDAGATLVEVTWPKPAEKRALVVADNGIGMTDGEFNYRWRKLNYNRPEEQGEKVVFPEDRAELSLERYAFGRNGIGRWACFCFGDYFIVDTRRNGYRNCYRVDKGVEYPFEIARVVSDEPSSEHGTHISVPDTKALYLSSDEIRNEIGMRFLTDPNFIVKVNGEVVTFEDIHGPNIQSIDVDVGSGNLVELIVIDTQVTDRSAKQHGVAWHVRGRLVGSCSWSSMGRSAEDLIDRRRIAARRFTFIVRADHLAEAGAIKSDWSGFDEDSAAFRRSASAVYDKVSEVLLSVSEEDRRQTLAKAKAHNRGKLETMSPLERENWMKFVNEAQEKCPSIKESDVVKLSEVMANLEMAKSGYALIHQLSQYGPDQLDELHQLFEEWTLDMAKEVLDEIAKRLRLVEELQLRVRNERTREVQDLQPLFEKGLWIFGPEYETIEYTSNVGMTQVVQKLFKSNKTASRNRPDFIVLPDGSAGLYSYPRYDEEGSESGIDRLVVVELKKPGIKVGSEQKDQCWKYVRELYEKGLLQEGLTRVKCFILGTEVDRLEGRKREELDGAVEIIPMLFETLLKRAESRLFSLRQRVQSAPFLQEHRSEIERFLEPIDGSDLLSSAKVPG